MSTNYDFKMASNGTFISDIEMINTPVFSVNSGRLAAVNSSLFPNWAIKRVFFITVKDAEIRGGHAHKECVQAFVCVQGSVRITCDDGNATAEYQLSELGEVLVIPPGIWVTLKFEEDSSLSVFASQEYDEEDYIRERESFDKWKK